MPRSNKSDPLDKFRWKIYIGGPDGFVRGGFSECSSPAVTINYKEYKEGGRHMNPLQINDGATFKPITLRRGVIAKKGTDDFAKWVDNVFTTLKTGDGNQYRRTIVIEHLDRTGKPVKQYTLFNCVPTFYEPASDFGALDDATYSLETLTFQYEGFSEKRTPGGFLSGLAGELAGAAVGTAISIIK